MACFCEKLWGLIDNGLHQTNENVVWNDVSISHIRTGDMFTLTVKSRIDGNEFEIIDDTIGDAIDRALELLKDD